MAKAYETQAESHGFAACLSASAFLTIFDSTQRCAGGGKKNEAAANHSTSYQDVVEVNHENAVDTIVSTEDGTVLSVSNVCAVRVRPSSLLPKRTAHTKTSYGSKLKTILAFHGMNSSGNNFEASTATASSSSTVPSEKEFHPHGKTMNGTSSLVDELSEPVEKHDEENEKKLDEERATVEVYYKAKIKRFPYLGLKGRRYIVETQNENYPPKARPTGSRH